MKVPQLKKKLEIKTCHNINWEDNYSWIHQDNILDVLRDKSKLDPEVKKYLEDENAYTEHHLKDTKDIQIQLFDEIKGRIKSTVINLTACRVATAAPTPYSDPTRLIPLIPPGAAPKIVVITSIFSNLLVHNPIANPVITKVKVINMAGLHKF